METAEVYKLTKGRELRIVYDTMAENPRKDFDPFGTFVGNHRDYGIFDKEISDLDGLLCAVRDDILSCKESSKSVSKACAELLRAVGDESDKILKTVEKYAIVLPVFMYSHGGSTIQTTPFSCPWDSGQIGFIFISKIRAMKELAKTRCTERLKERIEAFLKSEIETLDDWIRGDVYGFQTVEDDTVIDSCYGFYGSNILLNGIMDNFEKGDQRKVMLQMPSYELKEYRESKKKR